MSRTNEGGSVIGFIVVGGVLALLLIGGVWVLRNKAQEAAVTQDRGSEQTSQPAADKKSEDNKSSEKTQSDKPSQQSNGEPSKPTDSKQDGEPAAPAPSDQSADEFADTGVETKQPSATELPKTGPAQTITSIVGASVLAFAVTAYLRSRRDSAAL